jgi:endonuclease/exonuclease/phosphatase family metal-dependent hydrolase
LEKYRPDFICLQEVTAVFKKILLSSPFIMKHYIISENKIHHYGVLILTNKRLKNFIIGFYEMKFISNMGRSLLIVHLKYFNKDILINTAHFESLYENWEFRTLQLQSSFKLLDMCSNSLILGDFNFDPEFNFSEEKNINHDLYRDAWLEWVKIKKIKGRGETFPREGNIPPTRLDRVYYSRNQGLSLRKFEIIGDKDIEVETVNEGDIDLKNLIDLVRTPSDHKGLYLEFILEGK